MMAEMRDVIVVRVVLHPDPEPMTALTEMLTTLYPEIRSPAFLRRRRSLSTCTYPLSMELAFILSRTIISEAFLATPKLTPATFEAAHVPWPPG